jgi:predicted metalloprotease
MRLDDLPESGNIEDRRGETGGGGGGFGLPIGGGGLGIGTVVVLGLIGWALGIDPSLLIGGAEILSGAPGQHQTQTPPSARRTTKPQDETGRFVDRVLGSTEARWKDIFAQDGKTYRPPVLVLYRGATDAKCGRMAQSAMGPFYCPEDRKVYLDTSFFNDIARRFRGCEIGSKSCEFAQAYVIAHEVGHHVQKLTGGFDRPEARGRESNQNSERMELQADCYAGVWGHYAGTMNQLDAGDIAEGLNAAAAVGDDNIQKQTQGRVSPESFTHGTSAQRQRWLKRGLDSGRPSDCDTFGANAL